MFLDNYEYNDYGYAESIEEFGRYFYKRNCTAAIAPTTPPEIIKMRIVTVGGQWGEKYIEFLVANNNKYQWLTAEEYREIYYG